MSMTSPYAFNISGGCRPPDPPKPPSIVNVKPTKMEGGAESDGVSISDQIKITRVNKFKLIFKFQKINITSSVTSVWVAVLVAFVTDQPFTSVFLHL